MPLANVREALARGSFHAEFVANAEAKEEEENGAKDGLRGRKHFEPSGQTCNHRRLEKILAEADDVEGVRGTEAERLIGWKRVGR